MESGIQLKESGIPLTIGIRNPLPGIRNPEHPAVLESLTLGDILKEITLLAVSTYSIYLHVEVCGALKVVYPAVLCAAK